MTHKYSLRLGENWLVLSHCEERSWQLQIWGDAPATAEITADDDEDAKDLAFRAAIDKLESEGQAPRLPVSAKWNAVTRLTGTFPNTLRES